jgi:catechol 2,3-dioxygenase-like lactoylglutathione lyase family enzyme
VADSTADGGTACLVLPPNGVHRLICHGHPAARFARDLDHGLRVRICNRAVVDWDWSLRVFDHIDVHASDVAKSVRFYETVLAPLGILKLSESEAGACFANLNVIAREPPTTGLHVCFHARSREAVEAFHAAGVAAGYRSNGEPGYRDYGPGYYAAYLLDPDGNNVEALYRDEGNIGHGVGPRLD